MRVAQGRRCQVDSAAAWRLGCLAVLVRANGRRRHRWTDRPLAAGGIGAPLFIAMRASDPLQDLLYFVRYPWPWGKPHEAAGIHRPCRWRGGDVAARGTRAAASDAGDRVPRGRHAGYLRELCGWVSPGPGRG